ncbi:MAG TPA: cytochrome c [Acidobacteriaceae bacterium]|jgi:mono/diheme cytochrome c family protein|nr:cytochrome c [Acidobacteriaceae bacterium]
MRFLFGLILGLLILPACVWVYFHLGHPPVAVADAPFPFEKQIVRGPLHARIDEEMPKSAPIEASETNLTTGAQIYRQQCAACHGVYGRASDFGAHMYPKAPQLWAPHGHSGVVGVSDDPVGETEWKVANGIRLTGMPSFDKVLNATQIRQVSLLLKQAAGPLPPGVMTLIQQPLDFSVPAQ